MLALLALTVDESDEAFANVYSGAVSLQNLLPRVPQRLLVGGVAAIATVGALLIDLRNYQPFLYLLGSFFVPALRACCSPTGCSPAATTSRDDVFRAPELRPEMIAAWLAGFCLYQWLYPQGPAGGRGSSRTPHPHALPWGGASLPSFARRVRARRARARSLAQEAHTRERVIALLGNLSRDLLPGPAAAGRRRPVPRRARAAAPARARRASYARCADGRPRRAAAAARRARHAGALRARASRPRRFAFSYDGDAPRRCASTRSATRGSPADVPALPDGALGARRAARAQRVPGRDARRARPRPPASRSTARASCASPEVGPLRLDDDFDRELLRHVWVLKLADEEAEVLGDPAALGVREVLVTHGSRGVDRLLRRDEPSTSRRARSARDPTGAGDAFCDRLHRRAATPGFAPRRRGAARDRGRRLAARAR